MENKKRYFHRRIFAAVLVLTTLLTGAVTAQAAQYSGSAGKYTVTFDDANAISPDVARQIVTIFETKYPEMAARFNPNAPTYVRCYVDTGYDGVAYTTKINGVATVVFADDWLNSNPADTDCATHEFFHCVQDYQWGTAMWLVEGLADYARNEYGMFNDKSHWSMPAFSGSQRYTDSYRVTARFLVWLERYINPEIPEIMDDYLYNGQYSDARWVEVTGRTIDELWNIYSTAPSITRSHGDVDNSGTVDVADLLLIKSAILNREYNWKMDVTMDNELKVDDLLQLKLAILQS